MRFRMTSQKNPGTLPLPDLCTQYSFFLFDRFELIFADAADRAHPIVGKIGERSPGRNTVVGVAHSRVIDPVTYFTYVFVHSS